MLMLLVAVEHSPTVSEYWPTLEWFWLVTPGNVLYILHFPRFVTRLIYHHQSDDPIPDDLIVRVLSETQSNGCLSRRSILWNFLLFQFHYFRWYSYLWQVQYWSLVLQWPSSVPSYDCIALTSQLLCQQLSAYPWGSNILQRMKDKIIKGFFPNVKAYHYQGINPNLLAPVNFIPFGMMRYSIFAINHIHEHNLHMICICLFLNKA